MVKWIIFIAASIGILIISFPSLKSPKLHGFYRFFAFESIIGLILLNAEIWFSNPFSPLQIISWILLLCSIILVTIGFYLLRVIGKPQGNFENTTNLVKIGAYKYIRHPLYSSLLFLCWGAFLKDVTIFTASLALITTLAIVATAIVEEKENLNKFGDEYIKYRKETKMFVPFLF